MLGTQCNKKGGKTSKPLYKDFKKEGNKYVQCGMSSNKF